MGGRADPVLPQRARRRDELRRNPGRGLRHEPEKAAEGRLDRPDSRARRHRHPRSRGESRRRPDRDGGAARGGALPVRPAGDVHHPDAAEADRSRSARLLRVPHADHEHRRDRKPFRIQYSFIPFQNKDWPVLGTGGCGKHFVNANSNAFGNGIFDGFSIVVGHEYSEAVTDPDNYFSNQTAGTTPPAARTPTSVPGSRRKTSRLAVISTRSSRRGATRRSRLARTAARSRASGVQASEAGQEPGLTHERRFTSSAP
jgi:hypothetical protein